MPPSPAEYSDRRFYAPPTAADAAARARELHASPPATRRAPGRPWVIHVAAVARAPGVSEGTGRIIRIDEHAPKSHADTLSLNLVRARADAIIVSGQILRAEPELSYAPGRPGPSSSALATLAKRQRATSPPTLAILTRGDVPAAHRIFRSAHVRPLLVGPRSGLEPLRRTPAERATTDRWTRRGESALVAAIRILAARGARVVAVEAGPSVASSLYTRDADWLDELCLSTYLGPPLPAGQLARALPDPPATLTRSHEVRIRAASGRWRVERFVRMPG